MNVEHLMAEHGVKVTANRLLIARALEEAHRPLSMMELEERLESIDKSNVFRALMAFKDAHLVHVLDGDPVRYELCHSHHDGPDDDLLENIPIPPVSAPEGYQVREESYLLRGICPQCAQ